MIYVRASAVAATLLLTALAARSVFWNRTKAGLPTPEHPAPSAPPPRQAIPDPGTTGKTELQMPGSGYHGGTEQDAFGAAWEAFLQAETELQQKIALRTLADANPSKAIESLATNVSDLEFFDLASVLVDSWVNSQPTEVVVWCLTELGHAQAAELGRYAVEKWSDRTRQQKDIANWILAEDRLPAKAKSAALQSLIHSWVEKDATALMEWASKLPDGGLGDGEITQLVFALAAINPAAARYWNSRLKSAEERNANAVELEGLRIEMDAW